MASTLLTTKLSRLIAALAAIAALSPLQVIAADVTLSASDLLAGNQSSLDTSLANGNNWNNGAVPSAGNAYFTGNFILRTLANSASLTFAGDSLTVNNTNDFNSGGIFYKGSGATGVITINNLILGGGTITHQSGNSDLFRLAGNINAVANSQIFARQGSIDVTAQIGGSANITNPGSNNADCVLIFSSPANTFTGNVINNGRFTLADNGRLNFVIGASGVNNSVSGTGAATVFNGDFAFDLSGASTTLGDSWTVVSATNRNFGTTFNVAGFAEIAAGKWASGNYQFDEATGVLSVTTPPALLTLRVNNATGVVGIVNANPSANIDINYYEIHSPAGVLNEAAWTGIDGEIPPSDTSWEKAGGNSANLLSETTLLGMESFAPSDSVNLGHAYAGTLPAHQNLTFFYGIVGGDSLIQGNVEFVGGLPGDFNGDNSVDAADYVVWRDTDGTLAGYNRWRANFGATAPGTGSSSMNAASVTVPEPPAALLVILGLAVLVFHRRRRSEASALLERVLNLGATGPASAILPVQNSTGKASGTLSWHMVHVQKTFLVFAVCLLVAATATAQQVTNPIPTPITTGGLRVRIDNLVQMPSTQSSLGSKTDHSPSARARINFLRESPDGRLFMNDLRGQLYVLNETYQPQLYVDLDAANGGGGSIFPAMHFSNGLAAGFISFEFHPEFAQVGGAGYGKFYTIHMESAATTSAVPDFATVDQRTGSHPVNFHTIVTEWTTPTPLAGAWNSGAGSRRELLRVGTTADAYFHPYGDLEFNPLADPTDADYGLLYISGGDWGYINGAGAPQGAGTEGQPGQLQRLDTLAGTLIRIDPRSPAVSGGQAGLGDYTIPAANPFVDGNPNTFDEIYAFGFRNAHRMAWDQDDGTLYAMSVGHANLEEIERILPGGNYGWTRREGTFINGNALTEGGNGDADDVFANNLSDAADIDFRGQEFLYPVVQYDHGEGNAVAGGFVYEGSLPALQGKYIFGDIVNGRIFAANLAAMRGVDITDPATSITAIQEIQLYTVGPGGVQTNVDLQDLVGNSRADLRFGQDESGEIFILTKTDGFLRSLVAASLFGDLNANGSLDLPDFLTLTANLHTNVSGLDPAEAYLRGDLTGDLQINFADVAAFRTAYLATGTGSWEALFAQAPEPSSAVLFAPILAALAAIRYGRHVRYSRHHRA